MQQLLPKTWHSIYMKLMDRYGSTEDLLYEGLIM